MMKVGKATAKESTSLNVKYCPYCGDADLSPLKNSIVCRSCGASFVAARREEPMPHARALPGHSISNWQQIVLEGNRLEHARDEFDKALTVLDIPQNIRVAARTIFSKTRTTEMSDLSGFSNKGMAAAVVYAVCNQNGLSKSFEEIADVFGVEKTEVECSYTSLLNEMGYLNPLLSGKEGLNESESRLGSIFAAEGGSQASFDAERFLEKKGTYEFLRLLKERPRRWKSLEKGLPLSPRTLSERIAQALELGFIEKVRRLKIGATYYRLTKKGNAFFEAMTGDAKIY